MRGARFARVALSHYVTNGVVSALGLLLISAGVHTWLGAAAASTASVGVIVCTPPDQAAPRRGKLRQLLPAALLGPPLFMAVQALHASPLGLGLLLVPASFVAFLAGAWGRRGLPIAMSILFAMVFSMALPEDARDGGVLASGAHFTLGALAYLVWATLANALLNPLYRSQMVVDTYLALAALMRVQAAQFVASDADLADSHKRATRDQPAIGALMQRQAAFADQLQAARDIVLESPRTPRRQRLAALLMQALELRDHLLACELDLDTLKSHAGGASGLDELRSVLDELADAIERLADALLFGRQPEPHASRRARLQALAPDVPRVPVTPQALLRSLANRVGTLDDEIGRTIELARGEREPDLAVVRVAWQMFVSATGWSWRPLAALARWDAPPLRHALRAALAIGSAYALSRVLPWVSHDYWILLTIVVVLRGSLAQTLERRNLRVAGTLLGCVVAGALLAAHPAPALLLLVVVLAQAVAHAFALRRYLVTAVAATVLGLVQSHLLGAGGGPVFDIVERMADTLIGVAIAWAFSYVLPSWERDQVPALVRRALAAQARHARVALGLGQLQAVDNAPELEWRLARREAHDSLSALVQATQRSLAEPRAVRPPLEPLGRLLALSQQLLAQLTAVKTMLLLHRGRLRLERLRTALAQAAQRIDAALTAGAPAARGDAAVGVQADASRDDSAFDRALPDLTEGELDAWALRRLELASGVAAQLRDAADEVLRASACSTVDTSDAAARAQQR